MRTGAGVVVTTGQQPGLFGGPVYTWSKALSALALADALEGATGIPTAPVFWAATYDADFAESSASYVILNGDLVRLQQPLPEVADRSMRDTPLGDVAPLIRSLELASGSAVARAALDAVRAAYVPGQTIGLAYVRLLRAILEPLGIAVLDAGHPSVRLAVARRCCAAPSSARPRSTRRSSRASRSFATAASSRRSRTCADSRPSSDTPTARAAASRSRRRPAVDDDAELEANVLLRPIAERAILPTVAYVGGPGEVAYFAQATAVAQAARGVRARWWCRGGRGW